MKLKTIIENLDKSTNNEDDVRWISEELLLELSIQDSWNSVEQKEADIRLKCYWLGKHICTDTWVGIRAYFLDDNLACVSCQPSRKSDETFKWVSKDMFDNVKHYIESLIEKEDDVCSPVMLDLEQEFGDGYLIQYTGQLLTKDVMYKEEMVKVIKDSSEGYTNFHNITIKHQNGEDSVVDVRDIVVPWPTL